MVLEQILKDMGVVQNYTPQSLTCAKHFSSITTPTISITNYLSRINKYADCSDSCYVLAFIYLDRLLQNNPGFALSNQNIHRLLLSAIILAIKYSDDFYADNSTYAKIGGVSLKEVNMLEKDMLKLLRYDLYVSSNLYFQYASELELQAQKIMERKFEGDEMEWSENCSKPIRSIASTTSIRTVSSLYDMSYD